MVTTWQTKKIIDSKKGGDGGEIFIIGKTITGRGKMLVDGGDGVVGGNGGKVTLVSENNQFKGKIAAKGGNSFIKSKWWENSIVQGIALVASILGIIGFLILKK